MPRKITYSDLRNQEYVIAATTSQNYPGFFEAIEAGIDALIATLYETKDIQTSTLLSASSNRWLGTGI